MSTQVTELQGITLPNASEQEDMQHALQTQYETLQSLIENASHDTRCTYRVGHASVCNCYKSKVWEAIWTIREAL